MKKNQLKIVIAFLFALSLVACATAPTKTQTLTGMYQIYNAQYEDYMTMAANPATTEAQKQILRKKKPILDQLGTLIPAFDAATQSGTATASQQQQIMNLLNSLEQL